MDLMAAIEKDISDYISACKWKGLPIKLDENGTPDPYTNDSLKLIDEWRSFNS